MTGIEDRSAHFKEVIAYCEPGGEPICFEAYTYGTIAQSESTSQAENWDYVFIPNGAPTFLSDISKDEKWNFWSVDGYIQLADYLKKKKVSC